MCGATPTSRSDSFCKRLPSTSVWLCENCSKRGHLEGTRTSWRHLAAHFRAHGQPFRPIQRSSHVVYGESTGFNQSRCQPEPRDQRWPVSRKMAFRHGLLEGGRTLAEIRDAAGHVNVSTTSIYLHTVRDDDETIGNLFAFIQSGIQKHKS